MQVKSLTLSLILTTFGVIDASTGPGGSSSKSLPKSLISSFESQLKPDSFGPKPYKVGSAPSTAPSTVPTTVPLPKASTATAQPPKVISFKPPSTAPPTALAPKVLPTIIPAKTLTLSQPPKTITPVTPAKSLPATTPSTIPSTSAPFSKPLAKIPVVKVKVDGSDKFAGFFESKDCGEADCFDNLFERGIVKSVDDFTVMTNYLNDNTERLEVLKKSMPIRVVKGDVLNDSNIKHFDYVNPKANSFKFNPKYVFNVALLLTFEEDAVISSIKSLTRKHKPEWISQPFPGDIFEYIQAKTTKNVTLVNEVASKNFCFNGDDKTFGPFAAQLGLKSVERLMDDRTKAARDILFEILKSIHKNSFQVMGKCLRRVLELADDSSADLVYNLFNLVIDENEKTDSSGFKSFFKSNSLSENEYGNAILNAIQKGQFVLTKVLIKCASKDDYTAFLHSLKAKQISKESLAGILPPRRFRE